MLVAAVAAILAACSQAPAAAAPVFGPAQVLLGGEPAQPSASVCGFSVAARGSAAQVALMGPPPALIACVRPGEDAAVAISVEGIAGPFVVVAEATVLHGPEAEVRLSAAAQGAGRRVLRDAAVRLEAAGQGDGQPVVLRLETRAGREEAAVRWRGLRIEAEGRSIDIPISAAATPPGRGPAPVLPPLRAPMEQALIEWDWRMQDGIGTPREPVTYAAAVERTLARGRLLVADLGRAGGDLGPLAAEWDAAARARDDLAKDASATESQWEALWRRVHDVRRRIVFANPLAAVGPLVFVKGVPSAFSHQLTQYYGSDAKPGGGLFVLEEPGRSMRCRRLAAGLPTGSYLHPDVSFDGRSIVFAYCQVSETPAHREAHLDVFYRLYEVGADGAGLRQLTDGRFDDFSPRYLPNGRFIFISTRRGGFHRCGRGPCPTYTLALCEADGSRPRTISWHETHEWDPCVLADGRVIYTRWDYVDRHAVHYEQLWTSHPDGSQPAVFYGNNTLNPVGTWEARPVPGSTRVMATAAAHHAMTAGSIVLVDVARGVDGLEPFTRLTPDALFPESEVPVSNGAGGWWSAPVGVTTPPPLPPEQKRWPGHCYRSPWPLSETYFLAAYSYEALIGEPTANPPAMFGLYMVDAFGNKELIYRDADISSLWPVPLRPRPRPPVVPPAGREAEGDRLLASTGPAAPNPAPPAAAPPAAAPLGAGGPRYGGRDGEGTFFLANVYESDPPLPAGCAIKALRVVQVLPKTTPHANSPPVGLPNASPGKQVLGTVPVEPDGSAYFRAPAGLPLAVQALDERGMAVQVMRSVMYLQPGETASCAGCHEPRTSAPRQRPAAAALRREPSTIRSGPDGCVPLSYPRLVQPVLDRRCVRCHAGPQPKKGIVLTGEPEGAYTRSYNALAPRVMWSAWGGRDGDFRQVNSEPVSRPDFFGARGSPLMRMLLKGHNDVTLDAADLERLATWMDANGLFYGTFDPQDQARQQRGEAIDGPRLQ